jgi:hypothetical protein
MSKRFRIVRKYKGYTIEVKFLFIFWLNYYYELEKDVVHYFKTEKEANDQLYELYKEKNFREKVIKELDI